MQFIVNCFLVIWNCTGPTDPGGPQPAPEINAANGVAALALLLSFTAIMYRRWQQN
jgi:hypothetical protein